LGLSRQHCPYCALPLTKFACRADDCDDNPITGFHPRRVIVVIARAMCIGAPRFSLLVHGNPACRREREVMLCESTGTDIAMPEYPHIRTRYWFSCLDCESGQLDAARLRTRSTFPACLSHYLLCCFIVHACMYAWTVDGRNRCIPYQRSGVLTEDDNFFSIPPLFLSSLSLAYLTRFWGTVCPARYAGCEE